MIKVVSVQQMREIERAADASGVSYAQMMEHAGRAVAEVVMGLLGTETQGKRVAVLVGKGNNGGDGAAIARRIHDGGADVRLLLLGRVPETSGDARTNFERALDLATKHPRNFSFGEVQTIEGLSANGELSAVQQAFLDKMGLQCGFCTPGQIMQATALLASNPKPDEAAIRRGMSGNLCKCSAYPNILAAVQAAAAKSSV